MEMSGIPPYGVFSGRYRSLARDVDRVMQDWMPDEEHNVRLTEFRAWQNERLEAITERLWPRYDVKKRRWRGRSCKTAGAMSAAEIEVMVSELRSGRYEMSKKPITPLMRADMKENLQHYQIEDDVHAPSGATLDQYDQTLSKHEFDNVLKVIVEAAGSDHVLGRKSAGFFWFKTQLCRPRPYQMAMLAGNTDFSCEIANTALHSSITSGHCIQGMMFGCAIYEDWLDTKSDVTQERLDSLAQYLVDWGDRRVFAGVHYPTDNLASWSLGVNIIPHIFRHSNEVLTFARRAIIEKSRVFKIVNEVYRKDDSALYPAVTFLDEEILETQNQPKPKRS